MVLAKADLLRALTETWLMCVRKVNQLPWSY